GQQPRERFLGELRYPTRMWDVIYPDYLAFHGGVYTVDFARRTIHTLFTAADGETVLWARRRRDRMDERSLAVVITAQSVHFLTEAGAPVVSMPRAFDRQKHTLYSVGRLEGPERYVLKYGPLMVLDPEVMETLPDPWHLLEYDMAGREVARQTMPFRPSEPKYGQA